MCALMDSAKALATMLECSEWCIAYREAKAAVTADAVLMRRLGIYKTRHMAHRMGAALSSEAEKEIGALYHELMLDERARRFLESEREAVQITANICRMLTEACGVDVTFPEL